MFKHHVSRKTEKFLFDDVQNILSCLSATVIMITTLSIFNPSTFVNCGAPYKLTTELIPENAVN